MPGFDGTGPRGLGPRTGGGFGFCSPGTGPGVGGYAPGVVYGVGRGGIPWGGGRGRAFGGGRGRWGMARFPYMMPAYGGGVPYPQAAPVDEKAFLENQLAYLEQQLAGIKERLAEIGTQTAEE
jgi:hypothetical protein